MTGRKPTGPTHCKHPVPGGICAAFVPAGSPHPGLCDKHAEVKK